MYKRQAWTDATGNTTVEFDDVGRMTEIVTPAGTVGYGYNAAGEQTTLIQPEGTVTTSYDVNGFVETVTDWRGDTITMTNDADGRMIDVARSNGVDSVYGYDTAGRLNNIAHANGAAIIDEFAYTLDGNGNRTAVTSSAGTESYVLDGLNRITAATYPGGLSEAFSYDAAGNRTSHTDIDGTTVGYTVDATGQLVSDTTGATFTYDNAGNLTGTSAGDAYVYDDYGRATSITAGGVTETYGYDAQDVRVTVDGETQLWDRNGLPTLISTSDGDNYVHANGIARDSNQWLLADAVGSVRAAVDQTGVVSVETAFTAYGEPLQGTTDTFGFAGEQLDTTGLLHLRARQYNPGLGRFTTLDPVQPGAPGTTGYNLYTYSANNPTTFTDPSGQAVAVEYGKLARRGALLGAGLSAALTPWTCDQADNAWYQPSTNIDARCQLTEIGLGAAFGAIGGLGFGSGANIGRYLGTACAWGAVEGGTGAAAHARVQGDQISNTNVGLGSVFGCVTAGLFAGGSRAFSGSTAAPVPAERGANFNSSAFDNVGNYTPEGPVIGQVDLNSCVVTCASMALNGELPPGYLATLVQNDGGVPIGDLVPILREQGVPASFVNVSGAADLPTPAIVSVQTPNTGVPHAIVVDSISGGRAFIRDPLPVPDGSSYSIPVSQLDDAMTGRVVSLG